MSKWEQNAVFETSECICLVKRINGVVAQKTLESELVRCRECRDFRRIIDTDYEFCDRTEARVTADDFCSYGRRMKGADDE